MFLILVSFSFPYHLCGKRKNSVKPQSGESKNFEFGVMATDCVSTIKCAAIGNIIFAKLLLMTSYIERMFMERHIAQKERKGLGFRWI